MLFRTICSAIVAGIVAGFVLFTIQRWTTLPLIHQAELYERDATAARPASRESDPPQDEFLRSTYTCIGDVLLAIGLGMTLTATYALRGRSGLLPGMFWALAGFATFNLGPALVVPPSIPALHLVPLPVRQSAWLIAALSTGLGLALIVFGLRSTRLAGVLLVFLPVLLFRYLFPLAAPEPVALALSTLGQSFIRWTLADALLMWLVLGTVSGWIFENQQALGALPGPRGGSTRLR